MANRSPGPTARLTARDLELLEFIAEHRLVLAAHARVFLGTSPRATYARLRALTAAGLLTQRTYWYRQPGSYSITSAGLGAVGSGYSRPREDLSCYAHDVGAAWLCLAARAGAFGPLRDVISERALRSRDGLTPGGEPAGVRLGGFGPHGRASLHYPDLLLVTPQGHRIAVELELSAKGRARREKILSGYAIDARIDAVLYLTDRPAIARSIRRSAAQLGISRLVHVQSVQWGGRGTRPGPESAAARLPAGRERGVAR